jgi:hypothetical protein
VSISSRIYKLTKITMSISALSVLFLFFQNFSFSYLSALDFKEGKTICKTADDEERTCSCHILAEKEASGLRNLVVKSVDGYRLDKFKGKFQYYGLKMPNGMYATTLSFSEEACEWARSELVKGK